jgi:hypothetical protein
MQYLVAENLPFGKHVKVSANFVWDDSLDPGEHSVCWDLYSGSKLIKKGTPSIHEFKSSPHVATLFLNTESLGIGDFVCSSC